MQLISPAYKEQNRELHKDPSYGQSGHKYAKNVYDLCERVQSLNVLDYGCGKRSLEKALGFEIHNYDPCISGLDGKPVPADVVACTDVLEHIEPDFVSAVLDDLKRVTAKLGFFVIANRPARKTLPDGRNAHLIQEGIDWWFHKVASRFTIERYFEQTHEGKTSGMILVVRNKGLDGNLQPSG